MFSRLKHLFLLVHSTIPLPFRNTFVSTNMLLFHVTQLSHVIPPASQQHCNDVSSVDFLLRPCCHLEFIFFWISILPAFYFFILRRNLHSCGLQWKRSNIPLIFFKVLKGEKILRSKRKMSNKKIYVGDVWHKFVINKIVLGWLGNKKPLT